MAITKAKTYICCFSCCAISISIVVSLTTLTYLILSKLIFLIKHALSTLSVHYWGLHMKFIIEDYTWIKDALCWDCNIIVYLFIYSAYLWAKKVDRLCTTEEAGFLHYKFLCWDHFLLTDFTIPEGIILNKLAVPCGCDLCPSTSMMHKIAITSVYVAGQQCVKQYVMSYHFRWKFALQKVET